MKRAMLVKILILLNDANIEMGIIERKKEIDNSYSKRVDKFKKNIEKKQHE